MTVIAEYPFIRVTIDTRGLQPLATRAVGNVAVVGDAGGFGTAQANVPVLVGGEAEARTLFANLDASGAVRRSGPLYASLRAVFQQDPAPSLVYAVATAKDAGGDPDYAAGLAALAAAPVQFVCLAAETRPGQLAKLAAHITDASSGGSRRIGVAMVSPDLTVPAGKTFAEAADAAYDGIKSGEGRMILVAARVDTTGGAPSADVTAATMAAIAGYDVQVSILMKQVRGVQIPVQRQFSGSEIKQLAEAFIVPLIDPDLIPGEGIYIGSGRAYTSDTSRLYPDITRTLDQIEFLLKAGLIGAIGNVGIDRLGMQALQSRIEGILQPLLTGRVIAAYDVTIPLLAVLAADEAARTPGQTSTLTNARTSRVVEVLLSVTYAGSVHFLDINLALTA